MGLVALTVFVVYLIAKALIWTFKDIRKPPKR